MESIDSVHADDQSCGPAADAASPASCSSGTGVLGCSVVLDILPETEEQRLCEWIDSQLELGRAGQLEGRTYSSPPPKWEGRGQSREVLAYGVSTHANRVQPAVIVQRNLPPLLAEVVKRLVSASVFSEDDAPDTCSVNVYSPGQYLPPHVDATEFARPFVTVSLASDHEVLFGEDIGGECGEWTNGTAVVMPRRSVVILDCPAAGPDVKHALPSHPARRISLTFRRLSAEAIASFHRAAVADDERRQDRQRSKRAAKKAARLARKAGPDEAGELTV